MDRLMQMLDIPYFVESENSYQIKAANGNNNKIQSYIIELCLCSIVLF